MKTETFDALLEKRLTLIRSVLASKASEYASGADRLHNFKRAAAVLDCTPADACVGFMTKHLVSIFDLVDKLAEGTQPDEALVSEKIGDAINYLTLLEAIFAEERS